MSIYVIKDMRANGKEYYKLYEVKRINGDIKTKYVWYLGKAPHLNQRVRRKGHTFLCREIVSREISREEINDMLKIRIECDA